MAKSKSDCSPRTRRWAICGTTLLSVLGVLCISVSTLLWYFQYNRNNTLDGLTDIDLGIVEEPQKDITNIALFGIDTRNLSSFKGRSDSIIILSIDHESGALKLTSILRDTLVPLEGYGVQKINAAYSYGGPQLAIKTLNLAFNLNIRDYATVNFAGMADIIDAVGGVQVTLTEAELQSVNASMNTLAITSGTTFTPIETAGTHTLNGAQAVTFARIRKTQTIDGVRDDYGRTDRQRYILEQLFNKALTMDVVKYPSFIKQLLPYMETSLSYSEILEMSTILMQKPSFAEARIPYDYNMYIPTKDYPSSVGSVKYYNLDYAADMVHAFIYESISPADFAATHPNDTTPWYTDWVNGKWTL